MSFGIQFNQAAAGILNNLQGTQSLFQTSVQRLSSGLRINNAADDPAGLVISEKYKAQVDGLGQAIANAKDGINLVQTAEGALDEVSAQLRSIRTLAIHAANVGTNDTAAVAADQEQIASAIATIDRIVGNTQFGTRKLLDGSAGVGVTGSSNIALSSAASGVQAGSYNVAVTQAATQGTVTGAGLQVTQQTGSGSASTTTALASGTVTITYGTATESVTINSAETLDSLVADINSNANLKAAHVVASNNNGNLVLTNESLSTTATTLDAKVTLAAAVTTQTKFFGFTIANAATGAFLSGATAAGNGALSTATSAAVLASDETMTFDTGTAPGAQAVAVALKAGTTLADAAAQINTAVKGLVNVTASYANGFFTIKNNDYGSASNVANRVKTDANNGVLLNLTAATSTTIANGSTNGVAGGAALGKDVVGSISVGNGTSTINGTGNGQVLTFNTGVVDGLALRYTSATANSVNSIVVSNNTLVMQIGAFASQTASLSIGNLHTSMLGLDATGTSVQTGANVNVSKIDVTAGSNGAGAQDAILVIDAAIAQVSKQRASLGSFLKDTLQSTVRNSLVTQQNIRSSSSAITDADIATETMNLSKAQILNQTGIAMLAQANQQPNQLLALFR